MSKYDIYELMSEYTDGEFAPESDKNADIKDIRRLVAKRVKMPPRHIRLKASIAAAAVTAAAIGAGAALATPDGEYTLFIDMLTEDAVKVTVGHDEAGHRSRAVDLGDVCDKPPLELRDGRLWFVADGQEFDITDMIDMETGYIYKTLNPDTGLADWLAVGGTPEYYGYYEIVKYGEQKSDGEGCRCGTEFCWHDTETADSSRNTCIDVYTIDGVEIPAYTMTEEERQQAWEKVQSGEAVFTVSNAQWIVNLREEFGYPEGVPSNFSSGVTFSIER